MGGIIPPIGAKICISMSKKHTKSRVSRVSPDLHSPSRPRDIMDTPLWLILYWIDLDIYTSGFLRRRKALRLRNSLLAFLSVPSGSAWYVSKPQKES